MAAVFESGKTLSKFAILVHGFVSNILGCGFFLIGDVKQVLRSSSSVMRGYCPSLDANAWTPDHRMRSVIRDLEATVFPSSEYGLQS